MDDKKIKRWIKLFKEPNEENKALHRIKEIDVLLSELSNLKPGSQVFKGSDKSVFFSADLSTAKADLKKERHSLQRKTDSSSDVLAF